MKYPRQLSTGANNTVIVLSDTEVGKLFLGDTRSELGSEAEKMQFANSINNLVVRFIRLDFNESLQAEMLVMERIHPLDSGHTKWRFGNFGLMYLNMIYKHFIVKDLFTAN